VQDRGKRSRLSSPSAPRNSSTSLRRLRILLGGGVIASDEGGVGGVGTSPPAGVAAAEAATSRGVPSVLAPTVVAACLHRRRRRCLAPVVAAANDAGRLHVTVMTCVPAVWLNTTSALRPLTRHRSYNAEKSAMEIAGCDVEQAGSSTLPLTTLAHVAVGETREVGGQEESLDSWHPACPARLPATPEEGEAEWRGAWQADRRTAGLLRPPAPFGGGGGSRKQGGGQSEGEENLPRPGLAADSARVSSGLGQG
jgi:hypothetical protein